MAEILPGIQKDFGKDDITLSDSPSSERRRGWTFSYQSDRFRQSRHPKDGLLGNGPMFVDKYTAQVFRLPSGGWPSMLDEYDKTGEMPPVGRSPKSTQANH